MAPDNDSKPMNRETPRLGPPARKAWAPPAITEDDVLEAIAGACGDPPNAKTNLTCGGSQNS